MEQKNPYYLHEEKQLNEFSREENKFKPISSENYNNSNPNNNLDQNTKGDDGFARENSRNVNPQASSQPVQYPPIAYQPPSFQHPSYQPSPYPAITYQNPSYPNYQQNLPLMQQYEAIEQRNQDGMAYDHCPFCNKMTNSIMEQKPITIAWMICFLLFCFTVLLFWIPFCFSFCYERRYKCVKCGRVKYVIKNSC